jgi:hypothetical protein
MEEDILSRYSDLVQLALDDPVDQKNLLRKILLREGPLSYQIRVCAEGQDDTEEKGEKVAEPPPRSSSPVWLFGHGLRSNEISFDGNDACIARPGLSAGRAGETRSFKA